MFKSRNSRKKKALIVDEKYDQEVNCVIPGMSGVKDVEAHVIATSIALQNMELLTKTEEKKQLSIPDNIEDEEHELYPPPDVGTKGIFL